MTKTVSEMKYTMPPQRW